MKYHSVKSNARRDARKQFGAAAKEGVDYELVAGPGGHAARAIVKAPIKKNGPAKLPSAKAKAEIKTRKRVNRRNRILSEAGAPTDALRAASGSKRKRPVGPRKIPKVARSKPAVGNGGTKAGAWVDQLCAMLSRPKGATALEVGEAFGWLEHTSRARISVGPRSRNARAERTREERGGKMVSVYRLATELPLGQKRDELGVRYVKPPRERKPKAKAA